MAPPAHTRGLDVDLISNIQHFNDNLLIKVSVIEYYPVRIGRVFFQAGFL